MSNDTTKYCEHCLPAKRTSHIPSHIEYYLEHIAAVLERTMKPLLPVYASPELAWRYLLLLYAAAGVGDFEKDPDTSQLYNRSNIFLQEAQDRGIHIEVFRFFGEPKHEFRFKHNGRFFYFDHIPLAYKSATKEIHDKYAVRTALQSYEDIPVPEGGSFRTKQNGIEYGTKIGFPLTVKPQHGSLSCHTTYPINSQEELAKAIDIAKEYQPAYIVERYLDGGLYRASVLGQRCVFVCKKERPHVIGDGTHTIRELIEKKNSDPKRKPTSQKNATLHTIDINDTTERELTKQDMELDSVPAKDRRVILHPKYTLAAGCDIIECTEDMHPANEQLFKDAAEALNANIIGIDFICQDISVPYTDQQCGIIETNSRPYVDMHQYPSDGTPKDVAAAGWDIVLEQLNR